MKTIKRIGLFCMTFLLCTACNFSGVSSISKNPNMIELDNDQYKLPFECDINGEEWTLIAWDKKNKWKNLMISLEESEDCSIAFEIKQGNQTSTFLLQDESYQIPLNPDEGFELMAQIDGKIESKAKIKGEMILD